MRKKLMIGGIGILLAFAMHVANLPAALPVNAASPGDVVINEIMYNPGSGDQRDEYLELYNTTGSTIDVSDWCFSSGITLATGNPDPACFLSGTTITANGFLVVSPDPGRTGITYGISAVASYNGTNLANSGETVTLVDDTAQVIDTVTYDDVAPWPTSPDGNGPSLELKDPLSDNSIATNWGGSIGSPTPYASNSWLSLNLPSIANVTDPSGISASSPVTITAEVTDELSVTLSYRVNFDPETSVAMLDDGLSGDGSAGDGVYGVSIPGQAAGDLVRFRITASNGDGDAYSPSISDSMSYHGYVVADPSISTPLEVIQWFIDPADYVDMQTNHVYDNVYLPAVVAYGDTVYDNSQVRIKGDISRGEVKKSYKFKLPSGYGISLTGQSGRQLNEFHMDANLASGTMAEVPTSWWILDQIGEPTPDQAPVRLQQNGDFYGVYHYMDKYTDEFLADNGLDVGTLYENYSELENGPPINSQRDSFFANLITLDRMDPARNNTILDKVNIPALTNYMTLDSLAGTCWDHFETFNSFLHYDDTRDRFAVYYWDNDSCFQRNNTATRVSPYDYYGNTPTGNSRPIATAIYDQPVLRQMFYRRLKTVIDQLYSTDIVRDTYLDYSAATEADMVLDIDKWGGMRSDPSNTLETIRITRDTLTTYLRQSWLLPASQTNAERQSVYIDVVNPDLNDSAEYVMLSNSSGSAVDLSGWTIDELNLRLREGTVIPGNGSIYLVKDDIGYKSLNSPRLIMAEFSTDLGTVGGTLTLRTDQGDTIDAYNY